MKELRGALTSTSAVEALAGLKDGDGHDMQKAGPLAETLAQSVLEKYGFEAGPEGGLQHAVGSAMASGAGEGQADKKIRAALETIEEAITGKPSQSRLGRLSALDALAEKFLDMDT